MWWQMPPIPTGSSKIGNTNTTEMPHTVPFTRLDPKHRRTNCSRGLAIPGISELTCTSRRNPCFEYGHGRWSADLWRCARKQKTGITNKRWDCSTPRTTHVPVADARHSHSPQQTPLYLYDPPLTLRILKLCPHATAIICLCGGLRARNRSPVASIKAVQIAETHAVRSDHPQPACARRLLPEHQTRSPLRGFCCAG